MVAFIVLVVVATQYDESDTKLGFVEALPGFLVRMGVQHSVVMGFLRVLAEVLVVAMGF